MSTFRRSPCRTISALLVALASLGAAGGWGCGRKPEAKANASEQASGAAVSTAPATRGTIARSLEVTGSLVALNDVVVGTKMAGKVQRVLVRDGDAVAAGQVVAEMDAIDLQSQVQSARANLESALTRLAQSEALAVQARNQVRQATTNKDITDRSTQAGLQVARASLQSAEQALAVIKQGARPQEREQVQQQVRATKATLDKARADLKRMQELSKDQAISQSQLDQAQAGYEAAEAAYKTALETQSLTREGARPEDVRRAELAVEQAREGLKKAEADRDLVRLREDDVENARMALQSAESGVRAARAAVKQANAALAIANNSLSNAYVRSPISGVVAKRMAEPGQQLGGGGAVMRIVAPGSVYFEASLSESEYAEVALGLPVTVTVDAMPGARYTGRVARIMPVASSAARSFTLRVDFAADARLRPQMFARGTILLGTHEGVTLVPKDAVIYDPKDSQGSLFVAGADGKASMRRIRLGYSDTRTVEVVSGVKPGEQVIVAGQNALQDGDSIQVR